MALPFLARPNQHGAPEMEHSSNDNVHYLHPPTAEGVSLSELYQPMSGELSIDDVRLLENGQVYIGSYESPRASRRIGMYQPDHYDPALPLVIMDTPLGTSVSGHNKVVAESMMNQGFFVIVKGPPRYSGFTVKGLTLAEDANETFGVLQAASQFDFVPDVESFLSYGESQAAMKQLGILALARLYSMEVEDALIVAPCFLDAINWSQLGKNAMHLMNMGRGLLKVGMEIEREAVEDLRGTIRRKDLHHHAVVIPVLTSGEAGTFIPHILAEQQATVQLFGRDGFSDPHIAKRKFDDLPNIDVAIDPKYGHVDGILSTELGILRGVVLFEAKQRADRTRLRPV